MLSSKEQVAFCFDTKHIAKFDNYQISKFGELLALAKPTKWIKIFSDDVSSLIHTRSYGSIYVENVSSLKLAHTPETRKFVPYVPLDAGEMYIMPFSWPKLQRGEYSSNQISEWSTEHVKTQLYNFGMAMNKLGYDVKCHDYEHYMFLVVKVFNPERAAEVLIHDTKRALMDR
jgi:hypothetical protein